jgi:hypothetical protein
VVVTLGQTRKTLGLCRCDLIRLVRLAQLWDEMQPTLGTALGRGVYTLEAGTYIVLLRCFCPHRGHSTALSTASFAIIVGQLLHDDGVMLNEVQSNQSNFIHSQVSPTVIC